MKGRTSKTPAVIRLAGLLHRPPLKPAAGYSEPVKHTSSSCEVTMSGLPYAFERNERTAWTSSSSAYAHNQPIQMRGLSMSEDLGMGDPLRGSIKGSSSSSWCLPAATLVQ